MQIFKSSLLPISLHWTNFLGERPLLSSLHQRMPPSSSELSLCYVQHMALLSCGARPIKAGCTELILQTPPWDSWRLREHKGTLVSANRMTDCRQS